MQTVNLEDGMPSVPQARAKLVSVSRLARKEGAFVVKVIHGYGSTGTGGDLRISLQATLRKMADSGEIQACIYGENWRKSDDRAWQLLSRLPALKNDRDLGGRNKGITIVVL